MKRLLHCLFYLFLLSPPVFPAPPDVGFSVDLAHPTRKWEYTTFAGNTPSIPVSILTNGYAYAGLSSYSCELNYGLNDAASSLKTVSGTISSNIATFVAVSNSFPAKGDFFGEIFFSSGSSKITAGQGVLHVQRSPSSGSFGSLNLMNRICWDVVTNTGTVPWSLLTEPIFLASVAYNITAGLTNQWSIAYTNYGPRITSNETFRTAQVVTNTAFQALHTAQANTNSAFQALHTAQANTNSAFQALHTAQAITNTAFGGRLAILETYTGTTANALSSSVWALADSTTNYALRTALVTETNRAYKAETNIQHQVTSNTTWKLGTDVWAAADSTTNYALRTALVTETNRAYKAETNIQHQVTSNTMWKLGTDVWASADSTTNYTLRTLWTLSNTAFQVLFNAQISSNATFLNTNNSTYTTTVAKAASAYGWGDHSSVGYLTATQGIYPSLYVGNRSMLGTNLSTLNQGVYTGSLTSIAYTGNAAVVYNRMYEWGFHKVNAFGTSTLTLASQTLSATAAGAKSNYFVCSGSGTSLVLTLAGDGSSKSDVTNIYVKQITNGTLAVAQDLYVGEDVLLGSTSSISFADTVTVTSAKIQSYDQTVSDFGAVSNAAITGSNLASQANGYAIAGSNLAYLASNQAALAQGWAQAGSNLAYLISGNTSAYSKTVADFPAVSNAAITGSNLANQANGYAIAGSNLAYLASNQAALAQGWAQAGSNLAYSISLSTSSYSQVVANFPAVSNAAITGSNLAWVASNQAALAQGWAQAGSNLAFAVAGYTNYAYTAYGWGDWETNNLATGTPVYVEIDSVFTASVARAITSGNTGTWSQGAINASTATGQIAILNGQTSKYEKAASDAISATNDIAGIKTWPTNSWLTAGWSGYAATQQVTWTAYDYSITNLLVTGTGLSPNVVGVYTQIDDYSGESSWSSTNGAYYVFYGTTGYLYWFICTNRQGVVAPEDVGFYLPSGGPEGQYEPPGFASTGFPVVAYSYPSVVWKAGVQIDGTNWTVTRDGVLQVDATNVATRSDLASATGNIAILFGNTSLWNTAATDASTATGQTAILNGQTSKYETASANASSWTNNKLAWNDGYDLTNLQAGAGDLKADGTVPMGANFNFGGFGGTNLDSVLATNIGTFKFLNLIAGGALNGATANATNFNNVMANTALVTRLTATDVVTTNLQVVGGSPTNGAVWLATNNIGQGKWSSPVAFYVELTNSIVFTNTLPVVWQNKSYVFYNYGNAWDGTNFTCPVNGIYRFCFDATFIPGNGGASIRLSVNGTQKIVLDATYCSTTGREVAVLSWDQFISAGATVGCVMQNNIPATNTLYGQAGAPRYTYFSGVLVRELP